MHITKLGPNDTDAVAHVIEIYPVVYGGPPWNEGWKCTTCACVVPLDPEPVACPECEQSAMEPFWTLEKVSADFTKEMSRPGARAFVVMENEEIVGFTWGYELSLNPQTRDETATHIEAPQLAHGEWGHGETFFYLDEVGVLLEHRKRRAGENLIWHIWDGQHDMLLRTKKTSAMFKLVMEQFGGRVLFEISEERVIVHVRSRWWHRFSRIRSRVAWSKWYVNATTPYGPNSTAFMVHG